MGGLSTKVANWLANVLRSQYLHQQEAYAHIAQFLQVHLHAKPPVSRFKVRTAIYSSASGQNDLLVELFGTVAVADDTVPVSLWIPLAYPYSEGRSVGVPIVFVTPDPESGWVLRPGNHIDTQGRFYHPYLSSWMAQCTPSLLSTYNLLELMRVLESTFQKEYPLRPLVPPGYESPIRSPEIPAKVPFREVSGPPLPEKPSPAGSIPLKYRSPLPLPDPQPRQQQRQQPLPQPRQQRQQPISSVQSLAQDTYSQPQTIQPQGSGAYVGGSLLDQDDGSVAGSLLDRDDRAPTTPHPHLNAPLAHQIENALHDINTHIDTVNAHAQSIASVRAQLDHHVSLANTNKEILDQHINHLSQQVTKLTALNAELTHADEILAQSADAVAVNSQQVFSLDELITPDLALVNQLYNVAVEIKANKDVVALIGGNFHGQKELISDDTFDTCLKHIRALSRDTFWLEATRDEVALRINL